MKYVLLFLGVVLFMMSLAAAYIGDEKTSMDYLVESVELFALYLILDEFDEIKMK